MQTKYKYFCVSGHVILKTIISIIIVKEEKHLKGIYFIRGWEIKNTFLNAWTVEE